MAQKGVENAQMEAKKLRGSGPPSQPLQDGQVLTGMVVYFLARYY